MIKTLRLQNFKAFQDTGVIELKPITVLAGPNSGGKSSILHSLLLLKQTLEMEEPGIVLNLHGRFLQYSGFDEITFGKPPLDRCNVSYSFTFETTIPPEVAPDYFPDVVVPQDVAFLPLQGNIDFSFTYKQMEKGKSGVALHSFEMRSQLQNIPGPQLTISSLNDEYKMRIEGRGIHLPESYEGRKFVRFQSRHFLPSVLELEPDPKETKERPPQLPLERIFRIPLAEFRHETEELEYLGPLRREPQRAYLHSGSPYIEIGQRGENSAQILWLEKDNLVSYLPALAETPREMNLIDAVNDAFRRLGIDQEIGVSSEKSIMYQILFGLQASKREQQITIADVGFGVSQLLPVVVMGIRSRESALLLFEHPEIHLHPKLQANLADFLLTLALSGRRILVETHSIHFINRLRRRIVEDPHDQLKDKLSILFVVPPHRDEGARIEALKVDRYGVIENWPVEFLPETADEAEAIFRAGLEKRKR